MKRRKFLRNFASGTTIPFLLDGIPLTRIAQNNIFNSGGDDSDKVLVLVQMAGGNDGLNTLVPMDMYSNLVLHRSNIIIPENKLLSITDKNSLHPSMAGIKDLYDSDQISFVQNVAYPNQNRSHFRSTDIWQSASDANEFLTTGWVGRYFDKFYDDFPAAYPNDECTDPFAIAVGGFNHETCQGLAANYSMVVGGIENFIILNEGNPEVVPDTCHGEELDFIKTSNVQSNAYFDTLKKAGELGNNLSSKYPSGNNLASKLRTVARLISGGLKTKVFVVSYAGFDTHAGQVNDGNTHEGTHANLLNTLSGAISAFQDDLNLLGISKKVLGMTYSEFGRQIKSDGGFGTDHGTAGPMMLFGECVNNGIIGDNPEIGTEVEDQAGVPMLYDFRSVYASVLKQWFEIEDEDVFEILGAEFPSIPLIKNCDIVSTNDSYSNSEFDVFPNPVQSNLFLKIPIDLQDSNISIYNSLGHLVKSLKGANKIGENFNVDVSGLPQGHYVLHLVKDNTNLTKQFIKI